MRGWSQIIKKGRGNSKTIYKFLNGFFWLLQLFEATLNLHWLALTCIAFHNTQKLILTVACFCHQHDVLIEKLIYRQMKTDFTIWTIGQHKKKQYCLSWNHTLIYGIMLCNMNHMSTYEKVWNSETTMWDYDTKVKCETTLRIYSMKVEQNYRFICQQTKPYYRIRTIC